jgi:hypothetical protein
MQAALSVAALGCGQTGKGNVTPVTHRASANSESSASATDTQAEEAPGVAEDGCWYKAQVASNGGSPTGIMIMVHWHVARPAWQ